MDALKRTSSDPIAALSVIHYNGRATPDGQSALTADHDGSSVFAEAGGHQHALYGGTTPATADASATMQQHYQVNAAAPPLPLTACTCMVAAHTLALCRTRCSTRSFHSPHRAACPPTMPCTSAGVLSSTTVTGIILIACSTSTQVAPHASGC